MTKHKIIGEQNEATITRTTNETYVFECSRGMWCDWPADIYPRDTLEDVIEHAERHVDFEDVASVKRLAWR